MNKIYEKILFKKQLKYPFLKMKIESNKRNNLQKKLDMTLGEIYKQTGTLISRIEKLPSQFKNVTNKKYNVLTPRPFNKHQQQFENNIRKFYQKISKETKKIQKLKLTKTKEFHFNSNNDILSFRLNKYKQKKNEGNKNFTKSSSLCLCPTHEKIKSNIFINTNLYDSNNTFEITIDKGKEDIRDINKIIVKKMPNIKISGRNKNNKIIDKIYKMQYLLNDTNRNFHNINYSLINLSQNKNKTLNNIKRICQKRINTNENNIQNITIENDKINYQELFEPIKELLNKPLKQIKVNYEKNNIKQIWMKRSTANLLSFGQVSQAMHDDVFYKERKRIVESYPKYEKEANIVVKEKKKNFNESIIKLNIFSKKVDNIINMNKTLMKNICFKMKEKNN
jgi:hypothetical protein